jgi:hypothetical protein
MRIERRTNDYHISEDYPMPVKDSLTITILALCLLASAAEATNGYR